MKKTVLLSLLTLLASSAYAVENCSDEQRNMHDDNLHLMTQKIVYGPIKTIKTVNYSSAHIGSSLDSKTLKMAFLPCGELESYQSESKWFLNGELNSSLKRTIQRKPTYQMVNLISLGQPVQNMESKFTFEQDPSGKISAVKTQDQAGKDYTVTAKYNNGKIDSTKGFSEGMEVFYQYSYDDQGRLAAIHGNSGRDTRQFTYDSDGFFQKETRTIKIDTDEITTIIECLETDKYGNCLTETVTNSHSSQSAPLIETFKYQYQYY
ncbi:RHS repeat domain-containing protein [Providencia rettgeri]|uniref:YD repeat-containing protein n=1 Tax=Providencia rettgeri TaxID=587 RepID=A0AAJ4TJ65_PRORE|nr:RHS repeat domain-containing protein [Providencia rettgeri]QWQ17909.1 YD repeat-containing protein [Providencia rettgeri]QWQ21743.1 YD repeat-containing protein [Providencia rettgeri]QWQ25582.1 YD repeat-containing protein [Providencia rettgeri]